MKANDLIAALQDVDGDTEIYFTSCCYPETRWFEITLDEDGDGFITGYEGRYIDGDPDKSPFAARKN